MEKPNISKEEFEAYKKVRASGVTNMFDVTCVSSLSGLDRETIIAIMENYEELEKVFLDGEKSPSVFNSGVKENV